VTANRTLLPVIGLATVAALNVELGLLLASSDVKLGVAGAALPALLVIAAAIIASNRAILVFGAFALDLSGITSIRQPVLGGHLWTSDLLLMLAVASWAAAWLIAPGGRRPSWPKTPLLSWPLLMFAIFIAVGVVRGHERWGLSYLSQPLRFVLYAGIAFAIADLTIRQAWQALVCVFYLGAVVNAGAAVYHLANGTSQWEATARVSTGGTRALALTTALYLTGAVVLALLNAEREDNVRRRLFHLLIAGLAVFGIVVAYGRGVWFSIIAVLVVLFLTRRRLRGAFVTTIPLLLPALIAGSVLLVHSDPGFLPRLVTRFTTVHSGDPSVAYRQEANRAIWEQVRQDPLLGVGFGKGATILVEGTPYTITQDPHNTYLFLWAGGGAVTLFSFVLLFAIFLVDAWRRYRSQTDLEARTLIVACIAIWFCFALDTLSEPQLTQANSLLAFWTLMLLPSVVPLVRRSEIGATPRAAQRRPAAAPS
jgi:O-antigen ligase